MPEDDLVTCAALSVTAAPLEHGAPEEAVHPENDHVIFQEILDHSLYGRELDTTQCTDLMGHFDVQPCLRPSQVSPEMPPGGSYTMALVVDPPRRSARLASSTSKPAYD